MQRVMYYLLAAVLACTIPICAKHHHSKEKHKEEKEDCGANCGHCHACCKKEHEWSLKNDGGDYLIAGGGAYEIG